ncbi:MAG: hypothetical protein ACSHXK_08995 [Oceanococcus sp.]
MLKKPIASYGLLLVSIAGLLEPAQAETATEMQQRLNQEVMNSEFDAGDIKKAEEYANAALKRGEKPVMVAPNYWQPGWACSHLTRYRYYNYRHYRNCIYYRRYYGRYW